MAQLSFVFFIAIISAFLLFFTLSAISERESGAALKSALLFILFVTTALLIWLLAPPAILWAIMLILTALALFLLLPFGEQTAVQIAGEQCRYDERHIMFARANLKSNSTPYNDYYGRFPHLKKVDDAIRAKPVLLQPGGRFYEPVGAALTEVNFRLTESWIPLCDGSPSAQKVPTSSGKLTKNLKQMTLDLGAVDVGVAELNMMYVYSHVGRRMDEYGKVIHLAHTHILVFAVEMDYQAMRSAPRMPVVVESSKRYLQAARIAITVAGTLGAYGYSARAHIDGNYLVMLPAAASDAGLGEVGRLGYLIHPKYGARIRLAAVTTNATLTIDAPFVFGVQDFCRLCKKCAEYCPVGAISFAKEKLVRGVKKWSTNQEACYAYWRTAGTDCGICMRVCPYSRPASLVHNIVRAMIKRNRFARHLAVKGDKFFYPA
ncbi:4Fe-4S dicluster domain-containing protein [candidate division KSB1 bacterium]|nr:4Fe-4S dicluster domain-containing protein [candidate division KSB1 bacterium]RQW00415.1 MAG: 4Fe-4S dicluster domain-containing protein [candidate division KSB1 bacterium]